MSCTSTLIRVHGVPWSVSVSSCSVLVSSSDGARLHTRGLHSGLHLPHPSPVTSASLSCRGDVIVTASVDGLIRLFHPDSSVPVLHLGSSDSSTSHSVHVSLTADGGTIAASFSHSLYSGHIDLFDWALGVGFTLSTSFGMGRIAVSDDARVVCVEYFARDSRGARLISVAQTGEAEVIASFEACTGYFAADMDAAGECIALADGKNLFVHCVRTGRRIKCKGYCAPHAATVALARDAGTVMGAVDVATFVLWDANSGDILQRFEGHCAPPTACAIAHGVVISCAFDRTVRVWDLQNEHERKLNVECRARERFHGRKNISVQEARDGIRATVARVGCAWDVPREEIDEIVEFVVEQSAVHGFVEVERFVRDVRQVVGFLGKCVGRKKVWDLMSPTSSPASSPVSSTAGSADWKNEGR